METNKNSIIEKAGKIISHSGLVGLTLENLVSQLGVNEITLIEDFEKDSDIIIMLLIDFETELNIIINQNASKNEIPEKKLQLLFYRLYALFKQKPYYLSIIFDKYLTERDEVITKSLLRIKNNIVIYLSKLINDGKLEMSFNTKQPTEALVARILASFRLFMEDEQLINEMIRELKILKSL